MNHDLELKQQALAHVFPPEYENPKPKKEYDLVVLGAGTAGLIAALGAHALGGKVALIEGKHMGGDCLNTGCVPSKALIYWAKQVHQARKLLKKIGKPLGPIDFSTLLAQPQAAVLKIAPHDSVERFSKMGLDVFLGRGQFKDPHCIELDSGERLKFRKAAICTGASPRTLPIEGVDPVDILTNESLFDLNELPTDLVVVGSGPIGCEMAQSFARLGSKVTVVTVSKQLFERSAVNVHEVMLSIFQQEGIDILFESRVVSGQNNSGQKKLKVKTPQGEIEVPFDKIIMSIGRVPNTKGLGLDELGIKTVKGAVWVDDHLRTSQKHMFASGDVIAKGMFTHLADAQSRVLVQNAFTPVKKKAVFINPAVTYTDPEVASVFKPGVLQHDLNIHHMSFNDIDRDKVTHETQGFVHVYTNAKGVVCGGEIVHPHAGELLPQIQIAIDKKMKLKDFSSLIYAYPTSASIFKRMGDADRGKSFTPFLQKISRWLVKVS